MTVSVLLPNYNNGPYLRECLDSIFNQTYQNFVIYFVDDCSTDDSLEIAKSYPAEKMVIIQKPTNSGIVDTMNMGLDLIETKYFIRMDGDDISTPNRFEKLVDFMEKNPQMGACSSSIQTFGTSSELWSYEKDPEKNKANLLFRHSVGHASSIFRTSVFKENKLRYESLFWRMEDYLLFYRLKDLTDTTCIEEALYLYRHGEYNQNKEIHVKKRAEFARFYAMIFSDLGMQSDERTVKIHMEINRLERVAHSFKVYKKHSNLIIAANQKNKFFPQKELNELLQRTLRMNCYRTIDAGYADFFSMLPFLMFDLNLLKYYIRAKLKRKNS